MRRALIVSGDGFEDTELLVPYYRFLEAGVEVDVTSPAGGKLKGKHGYEVGASIGLDSVEPATYDILLIPGGRAPAAIRKDERVLDIARRFFELKKPVASICHGPQVLVSAGLMKGRSATCYRKVAGELKGAGARYVDREVVVDGNLITSRQPADLPHFMREIMKALA